MVPEIGLISYILALVLCMAGFLWPIFQRTADCHGPSRLAMSNKEARHCEARSAEAISRFSRVIFLLIFLSFASLLYAFATFDLSVQLVFQHAHQDLPLYYRLAALWGGHEGSMLLWLLILNAWICAVTFFKCEVSLKIKTLQILLFIDLLFIGFGLFTSNPFERFIIVTPIQGMDLNPLLQDALMLIHPPILYTGYVGFVVPFAMSFSKPSSAMAYRATCIAYGFLTLGIALGSFWAYYELGWGGFWFWDPVENASLIPWLSATVLIHLTLLAKRKPYYQRWVMVFALLTFILSVLGTFLVRSGTLTSVHSFAQSPERGVALLMILSVLIAAAFIAWMRYQPQPSSPKLNQSDEGLLLANGLLFFIGLFIVMLGTLYPLMLEALNLGLITVGAPYFNALMIPLGVIAGMCIVCVMPRRFNRATFSMHIAHLGFLFVIAGIAGQAIWGVEHQVALQEGESHKLGDYTLTLQQMERLQGPNYTAIAGRVALAKQAKPIRTLFPENRLYTARNMPMTEVAIDSTWLRDIYIALAQPLPNGQWVMRVQYKPFIRFLWLGAVMIALGALLRGARR